MYIVHCTLNSSYICLPPANKKKYIIQNVSVLLSIIILAQLNISFAKKNLLNYPNYVFLGRTGKNLKCYKATTQKS